MTIKEFIETAEEGGWSPRIGEPIDYWIVDPKVWQAVDKIKKWRAIVWYTRHPQGFEISEPWMVKMHEMIDAKQFGSTLEEYIATL